MKTILITGVSTGIGRAICEERLRLGDCVVGIVRNENSVADLELKYPAQFIKLVFDLTQVAKLDHVLDELKSKKISKLDVLINNAGVAWAGPFQDQPFNEIQATLTTNVLSVMKLTQVLLPMIIPVAGRIINISSVSGENGTPFLAAYCASKHAIEGFSESIRRELNIYGIKVILIGPGSIKTPIWNKGFHSIENHYQNSIFSRAFQKFIKFAQNEELNGLPVTAVVQDLNSAIDLLKPKIKYRPIPRMFRNYYLPKLFSKSKMDKIMCRMLGL